MSHFCVLVVGEDPESQLSKFDENIVMPRYVSYTKEQLITKKRNELEDYKNGTYAEFLKDPVKYKSECSNKAHINYLENEFPKKLNWTDEEVYLDAIEFEEKEDIGKDGEIYSTYNPNSKWDWYQLGGRYTGRLILKDNTKGELGEISLLATDEYKKEHANWKKSGVRADQARKKDIDFDKMLQDRIYTAKEEYAKFKKEYIIAKSDSDRKNICFMYDIEPETTEEEYLKDIVAFSAFAVLKNGEWFERGKMGGWGMVKDEKENDVWQKEFDKLIKDLPENTLLSIYDCHI